MVLKTMKRNAMAKIKALPNTISNMPRDNRDQSSVVLNAYRVSGRPGTARRDLRAVRRRRFGRTLER